MRGLRAGSRGLRTDSSVIHDAFNSRVTSRSDRRTREEESGERGEPAPRWSFLRRFREFLPEFTGTRLAPVPRGLAEPAIHDPEVQS